jgi:hypothetical protein
VTISPQEAFDFDRPYPVRIPVELTDDEHPLWLVVGPH